MLHTAVKSVVRQASCTNHGCCSDKNDRIHTLLIVSMAKRLVPLSLYTGYVRYLHCVEHGDYRRVCFFVSFLYDTMLPRALWLLLQVSSLCGNTVLVSQGVLRNVRQYYQDVSTRKRVYLEANLLPPTSA